jgi:diaminobutyrate-2-oxoglutarate transaminase
MSTRVFERYESEVRSYCRDFPVVFASSSGARMTDEGGTDYLDFLSGAGALNYGHNHPAIREALLAYIQADGVVHALDLYTTARRSFIERFQDIILAPRRLDYRMQFTGPTGTNAVEAAFKLARKVTGRHTIAAFTNAFHGMSLGSLAASATASKRAAAGIPLSLVTRFPYDGYLGGKVDTIALIEAMLEDSGSGVDMPAAIVFEGVQAEGGMNVARASWLRAIADVAKRHDVLLIADEVQTGCGRTGKFFSFEHAGITPDIVCLSKSIGGYGLPLSVVLIKPEHDVWAPGEHTGTFRGNNLALVAGAAALDFWRDPDFERSLEGKSALITARTEAIAAATGGHRRGLGLMQGIHWRDPEMASAVSRRAFENGLIAETCGARSDVLKLLPPLTIGLDELDAGLGILEAAALDVVAAKPSAMTNGSVLLIPKGYAGQAAAVAH